jgi:hypothetical protein
MNGKIKLMIPVFTAVFALMFVFTITGVMAEDDNYAKLGNTDHH